MKKTHSPNKKWKQLEIFEKISTSKANSFNELNKDPNIKTPDSIYTLYKQRLKEWREYKKNLNSH